MALLAGLQIGISLLRLFGVDTGIHCK